MPSPHPLSQPMPTSRRLRMRQSLPLHAASTSLASSSQGARVTLPRSDLRITRRASPSEFHQFYTQCHVIGDDARLTTARLYVCDATRRVLRNALSLLGVSAPTSM